MVRKAKDVTDAELSVLKVLWDEPNSSIRHITDQIYPKQSDSDYATVKKLLARLEKKRFVRRNRSEMAHTFEALLTMEELLGRRLESLADSLCGGSSVPLLMHLIREGDLSDSQRKQLRQLVSEHSRKQSSRKRGQ